MAYKKLYESFLKRAKSVKIKCEYPISKTSWKSFVSTFFTDVNKRQTFIDRGMGKGFNPQRSGSSRSLLDCYSALLYHFGDNAPNVKEFMVYCRNRFVFSWCSTVNRHVTSGHPNIYKSLSQPYLQNIIKGYEETINAQPSGVPVPVREKENS